MVEIRILIQAPYQIEKKLDQERFYVVREDGDYIDFFISAATEEPDVVVITHQYFNEIQDILDEITLNSKVGVVGNTMGRKVEKELVQKGYRIIKQKNAEKELLKWIKSFETAKKEGIDKEFDENQQPDKDSMHKVVFPQVIQNKVIAVCKGKASDGGSTLAENLAVRLASLNSKIKVLLMDGDIRNPNLAEHLNLSSYLREAKEKQEKYDFSEIVPLCKGKRLNEKELEQFIIPYRKNLHILCGSEDISRLGQLNEDHVRQLFRLLRAKYNYIIVDCSTHIQELITYMSISEESDHVVWATTSDYCSRKRTVKHIRELEELGIRKEKFDLIVNKYSKDDRVSLSKIKEEVKEVAKIKQVIGYSSYMLEAIDVGKPLVLSGKDPDFVRQIDSLIMYLLHEEKEVG